MSNTGASPTLLKELRSRIYYANWDKTLVVMSTTVCDEAATAIEQLTAERDALQTALQTSRELLRLTSQAELDLIEERDALLQQNMRMTRRYGWLRSHVSGKEYRRIGIEYTDVYDVDNAIDALLLQKQQGDESGAPSTEVDPYLQTR